MCVCVCVYTTDLCQCGWGPSRYGSPRHTQSTSLSRVFPLVSVQRRSVQAAQPRLAAAADRCGRRVLCGVQPGWRVCGGGDWGGAAVFCLPYPYIQVGGTHIHIHTHAIPSSNRGMGHWSISAGSDRSRMSTCVCVHMSVCVCVCACSTLTCQEVASLQGAHQGWVHSLQWSGDSKALVSASADGTAKVCD